METAMEYFSRQMNQQLAMWKEAPLDTLNSEDVLDKMCKTHIDASLMSVAYSLAIMADSLKVLSESMEEGDEP
jgi:hypothetical protein